jgi:hypothetical protein
VKTFLRANRVSRSTLRRIEQLTSPTACKLRLLQTRAQRQRQIIEAVLKSRFPRK